MHPVARFCVAIGITTLASTVVSSSPYAGGNQVYQDTASAIASSSRPEDRDKAIAEEKIGDMFWQGSNGHPRDSAEAVRHYDNAAKLGMASAERKLAIAYANGEGAPADDVQMLRWQRKAAEAGDAMAAGMLGYAIMIGLDGTYDAVEAATWLTLAAEDAPAEPWRSETAAYAREAQGKLTSTEREAFRERLGHRRSVMHGK